MLQVIERNGVKLFVDIESGAEQDEMPDLWVLGTLWDISECDRYQLTCGQSPQDSALVASISKTLSDEALVAHCARALQAHHRQCLAVLEAELVFCDVCDLWYSKEDPCKQH